MNEVESDSRLPRGNEIFLDHIAHFVTDAGAASRALTRAGFAPTPISVQVNADSAGRPPQPTGTGNVTAMLDRGYMEVLFKTADTPLGREFDAAMARYPGIHLAAFAVADAAETHHRLAAHFAVQPLVSMQRPVDTESGADIAAFSVVRLQSGQMPEGRIQALTHRTENTVWQRRWLTHPNSAKALLDIVIAVANLDEAQRRFVHFLDRSARGNSCGYVFQLDRGRVQLAATEAMARLLPHLAIPTLPFMATYGLKVSSLDSIEACLRGSGITFDRRRDYVIAPFPDELGIGCWAFVEDAADLPWRR